MDEPLSVALTRDEALVLFEFFARFNESDKFNLRSNAEFVAFMRLAGQLEKQLLEPFAPDYQEQLRAAAKRLSEGFDGAAPGVETPETS